MDSSSADDTPSPNASLYSAPPIRSAVLKSMFPEQNDPNRQGGVVTKTMYSGNITASKKCADCGGINSRSAKKCQHCGIPLKV